VTVGAGAVGAPVGAGVGGGCVKAGRPSVVGGAVDREENGGAVAFGGAVDRAAKIVTECTVEEVAVLSAWLVFFLLPKIATSTRRTTKATTIPVRIRKASRRPPPP